MDIKDLYKDYKNFIDKTIEINGWIKNHRKQAPFGFIDLTDGTSFKTLQVVYEEDKCDDFESVSKLKLGSAIKVQCKLISSPN